MPIHNWNRVPVGLFHHFHQSWASALCNGLNEGTLPKGSYALIEKPAHRLTKVRSASEETDAEVYAGRANRLAVRDSHDKLVAMIEILSPGHKECNQLLKAFVEQMHKLRNRGVNLLIIDLFPPTSIAPHGIHKAIWDQIHHEPFDLPAKQPLTLAAYSAGEPITAYVDNVAANESLPGMPLFLSADTHVLAPLEETYVTTWKRCPAEFREIVEKYVKP